MAHIELESHLPGITGLLEYRKDSAEPIRELTQLLLRGPSSLSTGERELIATMVSSENGCTFCTTAHAAVTGNLYGDAHLPLRAMVDLDRTELGPKIIALLRVAQRIANGGKNVTGRAIAHARECGATDLEIHDTVLIAALFCLYNRYVDGLATHLPDTPDYFGALAARLADKGYVRAPEFYEKLKEEKKA